MSDQKSSAMIYPRLCIAYFLQFAIWGSWSGALGGYAGSVLNLSGPQIGWLYSAIPFGAVISPLFIGPIADRFFSAQKVVAFLHLIGGACLLAAGGLCLTEKQTFGLLMTAMMLSGICFMPTIALVNSIVFKHLPNPNNAPRVFMFGTLGWIIVNLFIAAFCDGAKTPNFFVVGGVISLFLAVYSLTLPNTPPKGAPAPGEKSDALGLGALKLFKDPAFAIFALCAFCASIPACNYFFPSMVDFLSQRGYPSPLALTTLNQFSELFFMAALPFFVAKIGLKRVLLLGMAAWSIRYVCFAQEGFGFALVGLILHGLCYSFLYVAAYIYADKKAPADMKASVQSLMAFLLLGVGQVLGGQMYGGLHDAYPPEIANMDVAQAGDQENVKAALPPWNDVQRENSAWKYLDLGATVSSFMQKKTESEDAKKYSDHLGIAVDANKDNVITQEELNAVTTPLLYHNNKKDITYTKENLDAIFAKVAETSKSKDGSVTHAQWLAVQAYNWRNIYLIGAAFIAVFFLIFLVLGKDPVEPATAAKKG